MHTPIYLLVLTVLIVSGKSYQADKISYFIKLIEEGQRNASNYEKPTSNSNFQLENEQESPENFGKFDFIIIGAGAAGSILATRLTEIRKFRILLIEAGEEETDYSNIPSQMIYLQYSPMDWGYKSTSQKTCCLGMKNQQCVIPRGRAMGGSTSIHGMMYVRGNLKDYDAWEKLGNEGWNSEVALKYFKKSERSRINGDAGYHGSHGEWLVDYPKSLPDTVNTFLAANEDLGRRILDYNGAYQNGAAKTQFNIRNGRRQSTATAFLSTARRRHNLKITKKSLATKILIDDNKKAYGVVFRKNGKQYVVYATREVIVSGGAINTPQLLMLSGIGPKQHLEDLGITVIQDLPVGETLEDHVGFYGMIFHTNYTMKTYDLQTQVSMYLTGEGPLSNPGNSLGIGFVNFTTNDERAVPDLEYIFVPPNSALAFNGEEYNFNDNIKEGIFAKITPNDLRFNILLMHPKSKGRITLKSRNPADFPNIDVKYFSDSGDDDVDKLYQGVQYILKLMEGEQFTNINATLIDHPICKELKKNSKEFWYCLIKQLSSTMYHSCGSARMGPDRESSVVDNKLRVHGVQNLRVVDSSVIPEINAGHTVAPTVMIAERASDIIKIFYRVRS